MLKYALLENFLTSAPNDYIAQIKNARSYTMDEIVERMLARGSTVTKPDILSVFENLEQVAADIIADGGAINTDLFQAGLSISGIFDSAEDSFSPSRHQIRLNLFAGKRLRKAIAAIKTKKINSPQTIPCLLSVKDHLSDTSNATITPGGVVEVTGSLLKIEGDAKQTGIYLIDADRREFKAPKIIQNKPARLIFIVPDLAPGAYRLEIRTLYRSTVSVRCGSFAQTLVV